MILVIQNSQVVAVHEDGQNITPDLYPGAEIASWAGKLVFEFLPVPDPRTDEEKAKVYRDRRRLALPSLADQLDMIYWDKVNGTNNWQATIAAVKTQYPKV